MINLCNCTSHCYVKIHLYSSFIVSSPFKSAEEKFHSLTHPLHLHVIQLLYVSHSITQTQLGKGTIEFEQKHRLVQNSSQSGLASFEGCIQSATAIKSIMYVRICLMAWSISLQRTISSVYYKIYFLHI